MSTLSAAAAKIWRWLKGGRTDAEVVFGVIVGRLSGKEKHELWQTLSAVQFAVDVAALGNSDPRIGTAQRWVAGALAILEE